ncbi:MAG TPA: maleylpyruvate isomerase N-terminal domain-containing protein [Mycobacterium sp.]|nr:maleylpyruvate isomerase N-terminal domain-containing protein [Mycobacterium sp.]
MSDDVGVVPRTWLDGCVDGHRRLEAVLAAVLTDDVARQPSRLPGWTVGHLVTHLARNADAHRRVVEAAGRDEVVPMYPGGEDERATDIDAGAGRTAAELVTDLLAADQRLEAAWRAASHETWTQGLGLRAAGPTTVSDFVFLRWREVEVHLADLGIRDPEASAPDASALDTWDALPPVYLDGEWARITASLADRLPSDLTVVLVPGDRPSRAYGRGAHIRHVHGTAGRLLAWLLDRGGDPSWPTLAPWA